MSEEYHSNITTTDDAGDARISLPALRHERYMPMLEDIDVPEEQAHELLQVLWNIMCGFVELGFGTNSVQRIMSPILKEFSDAAQDEVESEHSNITTSTKYSGGADETRF